MQTTTTALTLVLATLSAVAFGAAVRAGDPDPVGEPAYVGTWASDLAQCKVGQEKQEAPLVFSKDGYDQYETHCKFKSATASEEEWKVSADCTVEGNAQPYDFTLTVSGDTLTFTDTTGARDLLRCQ
jgi:hypothetical protein